MANDTEDVDIFESKTSLTTSQYIRYDTTNNNNIVSIEFVQEFTDKMPEKCILFAYNYLQG